MRTYRPLTSGELAEISARAAAASPGPWMRNGKSAAGWRIDDADPNRLGLVFLMTPTAIVPDDNNAAFIAEAREDIPLLVQEILQLREEAARCELERDRLAMAIGTATASADRFGAMLDQALISLAAAGIVTPEKGFRGQLVVALACHIDELAQQRDEARRQLALAGHSQEARTPVQGAASPGYPVDETENPETRA